MTDQTITVVGARGGSGASTVATAIALFASRAAVTELVAADVGGAAALLGLGGAENPRAPIDVTHGLTLVSTASHTAHVAVVDAGRLDQSDGAPSGLLLVVLRGPCYLGLRSTVMSELQPDGIVLLSESGRCLTQRDVRDVCGVPVVAEIPVTANVARTIDAGLLITRSHALRELTPLRRYINTIETFTDPAPDNPATRSRYQHPSSRSPQHARTRSPNPTPVSPHLDPSPPTAPSTIATDLPVPLSGTVRRLRGPRSRQCQSPRPSGSGPLRTRSQRLQLAPRSRPFARAETQAVRWARRRGSPRTFSARLCLTCAPP
jgi:hypothetical protein